MDLNGERRFILRNGFGRVRSELFFDRADLPVAEIAAFVQVIGDESSVESRLHDQNIAGGGDQTEKLMFGGVRVVEEERARLRRLKTKHGQTTGRVVDLNGTVEKFDVAWMFGFGNFDVDVVAFGDLFAQDGEDEFHLLFS